MAYMVMVYIVMTDTLMAYVLMAYIVPVNTVCPYPCRSVTAHHDGSIDWDTAAQCWPMRDPECRLDMIPNAGPMRIDARRMTDAWPMWRRCGADAGPIVALGPGKMWLARLAAQDDSSQTALGIADGHAYCTDMGVPVPCRGSHFEYRHAQTRAIDMAVEIEPIYDLHINMTYI